MGRGKGGNTMMMGFRVPGWQGDNSDGKTASPKINCAFEGLKGNER